MGRHTQAPPAPRRRAAPLRGAFIERAAGAWQRLRGLGARANATAWWIGSRDPVTLRLPKGLLVGFMAVVLLLLGLAYSLGRETGEAELVAELTPSQKQLLAQLRYDDTEVPGGGIGGLDPYAGLPSYQLTEGAGLLTDEEVISSLMNPAPDPRIPGLNYLHYVTTTPEQAERFQHWAARHRVSTLAIQSPSNPKYVIVVDVTRGFTPEEIAVNDEVVFKSNRLMLGKKWKRFNNNRGHDLDDMYFRKYTAD